MKGNRDHRLLERAAAIGLRACRRSGHCRQTRLNVEACKFRMCQFFWWGSPCTGQSTGGGPYLFSVLRNRFRANLSYAPWRGCTKPGTLTWRATVALGAFLLL